MSLYVACLDLLTVAEASLVADGIEPPDRQYVSLNRPALDCCDTLTVHWESVRPSERPPSTGTPSQRCAQLTVAQLVITCTRCVHGSAQDGTPPSPAELDSDAMTTANDADAIWHGVFAAIRDGSLFSMTDSCRYAGLVSISPLGPQGGCGGFTMTVLVEVRGTGSMS